MYLSFILHHHLPKKETTTSAGKMYHIFSMLISLNQTISIVTEKIPTIQKPIGYQNLWWKNNDLKRAFNNYRVNSRQLFNLFCLFCGFLYIFRCASNISLTGEIPKLTSSFTFWSHIEIQSCNHDQSSTNSTFYSWKIFNF